MVEVPNELQLRVRETILKDLSPSSLTVWTKCGFAVLGGGLLSLFLCGQFGIGMTHLALHLQHRLHTHASSPACALLCGSLFALLAPLILRVCCSALQFRAIVRRGFTSSALWFIGLGAVLAHHGDLGGEILFFVLWLAAAVGTFRVVCRGIERISGHTVPV